jgi:5-bromo-4-chloroindolyl phosphate hydrolysis protein
MLLRLSLTLLFIGLITLAAVQYGINVQNEESNMNYQKVLSKSLQNQEMISELGLMSRTYMNIKNNLEPA